MANQKGDTVSTGHFWNRAIDAVNKKFETYSFWSKASDTEFDDGGNAETKVGAIKGITSDLNTTTTGYAADMTALAKVNSSLNGISVPSHTIIANNITLYRIGKMRILELNDATFNAETKIPTNDCPLSLVRGACVNTEIGTWGVCGAIEVYPDGSLKFTFFSQYNSGSGSFVRYDVTHNVTSQIIWFIE